MSIKQLRKANWIAMCSDILKENPKNKELVFNLKQYIGDAKTHYSVLSTDWILAAFNAYCIPNYKAQWNDRHERMFAT